MTDHLTPITLPAWVVSDLMMSCNFLPTSAYKKVEQAIDQAARALDAAKGPPSAPEAERGR